jgi:hypothetical protein
LLKDDWPRTLEELEDDWQVAEKRREFRAREAPGFPGA